MPETVEDRLRVAENRIIKLQSDVAAVQEDVRALAPLVASYARLDERMGGVESGIRATRKTIGEVRTALEDRDRQATDERKAVKVALIALTGVILSALIAAGATILATQGGTILLLSLLGLLAL